MTLRTFSVSLLCAVASSFAQISPPLPSAKNAPTGLSAGQPASAAQSPAKRLEFEVASIKLDPIGGPVTSSPGGFLARQQLSGLISGAYGPWDGPRVHWPMLEVVGGPSWAYTDRYEIAVKAAGPTPYRAMHTVMMQTLLEERYHLKVHIEPREASVFFLTVIGDKPKLTPTAGCVPSDPEHPWVLPALDPRTERPVPPGSHVCGWQQGGPSGLSTGVTWIGVSMADFAGWCIPVPVGRPVIDKTGN